MSKLQREGLSANWNSIIESLRSESDRGAAVLAAGFVDNLLGLFLGTLVVSEKAEKELFEGFGPLSSFSHRTTVVYAFGFIGLSEFERLDVIRKLRNHFAHHPLGSSFGDPEVMKYYQRLPDLTGHATPSVTDAASARNAFIVICADVCARLYSRLDAAGLLQIGRSGNEYQSN